MVKLLEPNIGFGTIKPGVQMFLALMKAARVTECVCDPRLPIFNQIFDTFLYPMLRRNLYQFSIESSIKILHQILNEIFDELLRDIRH